MKLLAIFLGLLVVSNVNAQVDETTVEGIVKNAPCMGDLSIEEELKNKIRIRSHRDLGWQVFKEEGQYAVERAFLMNKSMQLHFRWHVNYDGTVKSASKRTEALCTE